MHNTQGLEKNDIKYRPEWTQKCDKIKCFFTSVSPHQRFSISFSLTKGNLRLMEAGIVLH